MRKSGPSGQLRMLDSLLLNLPSVLESVCESDLRRSATHFRLVAAVCVRESVCLSGPRGQLHMLDSLRPNLPSERERVCLFGPFGQRHMLAKSSSKCQRARVFVWPPRSAAHARLVAASTRSLCLFPIRLSNAVQEQIMLKIQDIKSKIPKHEPVLAAPTTKQPIHEQFDLQREEWEIRVQFTSIVTELTDYAIRELEAELESITEQLATLSAQIDAAKAAQQAAADEESRAQREALAPYAAPTFEDNLVQISVFNANFVATRNDGDNTVI